MKKLVYSIVAIFIFILGCGTAFAGNGNGLPPGERFMLNIIAYDNCPAGDFTDSNRHMIAVAWGTASSISMLIIYHD